MIISVRRSQWPRGLKSRSAAARLLRLWVRFPPGAWMFVCCECCVLSGRGLCDQLITCPEESYRLWCFVVCDLETSFLRSQTSIVIELKIGGHRMYLLHAINSDRQHNCWMSSDRLQYIHIYIIYIYICIYILGGKKSYSCTLLLNIFSLLFVSLALQPTVVVFSQPGSGL